MILTPIKTCTLIFIIYIASTFGSFSKAESYITASTSINEVYQQCINTVARSMNIQCIKGLDYTKPPRHPDPSNWFENDPKYKSLAKLGEKTSGEKQDLENKLALVGGPQRMPGHSYYAFLYIYKNNFVSGTLYPTVHASLSLTVFDPATTGIGNHSNQEIVNFVSEGLKSSQLYLPSSPEGAAIVQSFRALAEEQRLVKDNLAAAKKSAEKPACQRIEFSGIAAINSDHIQIISRAKNPTDLLSRNPLVCEEKAWGGTYLNGGILNRIRSSNCKGIGIFKRQIGEITNWTADVYQIETEVFFNTGPKRLILYVRRNSANCVR